MTSLSNELLDIFARKQIVDVEHQFTAQVADSLRRRGGSGSARQTAGMIAVQRPGHGGTVASVASVDVRGYWISWSNWLRVYCTDG